MTLELGIEMVRQCCHLQPHENWCSFGWFKEFLYCYMVLLWMCESINDPSPQGPLLAAGDLAGVQWRSRLQPQVHLQGPGTARHYKVGTEILGMDMMLLLIGLLLMTC